MQPNHHDIPAGGAHQTQVALPPAPEPVNPDQTTPWQASIHVRQARPTPPPWTRTDRAGRRVERFRFDRRKRACPDHRAARPEVVQLSSIRVDDRRAGCCRNAVVSSRPKGAAQVNARSLQCGGIVAEHKNNKVAVVDVEHLNRRDPLNLNRLSVRSAAPPPMRHRREARVASWGVGYPGWETGSWSPPTLGVIR